MQALKAIWGSGSRVQVEPARSRESGTGKELFAQAIHSGEAPRAERS